VRRLFNNNKHWRDRAEETRALAEQINEAETGIMLDIANGYDRLAELAKKRKAESQNPT